MKKTLFFSTMIAFASSGMSSELESNTPSISSQCKASITSFAASIENGKKPSITDAYNLAKQCNNQQNISLKTDKNITPEQCIQHFDKAFELSQIMINRLLESDDQGNPKIKDNMASIYDLNDANRISVPALALIWIQRYFNDLICDNNATAGYNTASALNDALVLAWAPYSKLNGFKDNKQNDSRTINTLLKLEK